MNGCYDEKCDYHYFSFNFTSIADKDFAMLCKFLSSRDLKGPKSDQESIFWIFGSWLSFTKK